MNILIAAGSDFNNAQSAKHNSSNRIDVIDSSDKLLALVRERNYERVVLDFNLGGVDLLKKLAQHYSGTLALYNVGVSNTTNIEEACRGMNVRYVRSATDGI
ncbi:MAG: hypothetical protein IPK68_05710 [Bdellovibrionales bacterium]|jgi:DNA-binding NtrC family response regulator|nr:hypothetical protein [Bdellovibrionales bacterium]